MKKKAYSSDPSRTEPPTKFRVSDLEEGLSHTETGGRGISLSEMTSDYDATDPQIYEKPSPAESQNQILSDKLLQLFMLLGDEMDNADEEVLANFADFMMVKVAEVTNVNYTEMFNQLMIKVNNADLVDTNEILKKLTKIYSRTLALEHLKGQDLKNAKESAYKKTLHRADQYISE